MFGDRYSVDYGGATVSILVEVGLIQKEQLRLEASSRATGVLIMLFFKIDLRAQVKLDAGDDGMTDLSKLTIDFLLYTDDVNDGLK